MSPSPGAPRAQRFDIRLDDRELDTIRAAADAGGRSQAETVRAAIRAYARPRPVYSFDGAGPSFVRDSWAVHHPVDSSHVDAGDAGRRLSAFRQWQQETAAQFVDTTTASEVVEPGYMPTLADFTDDRPLFAAATRARISDATAFNLPGNISRADVDGAVSSPGEGTNPPEGTLTFDGVTVQPRGVTGLFSVTRELIDSSNPAVDAIALSVMRESFARQTEARIFAELNTVQSGTITAGQVPSGAQVRTSTSTALPADLRRAALSYANVRGRTPRAVVASTRPEVAEELETLDVDAFALQNVSVALSPRITGTATGDGDVFLMSEGDVWAWSSPLLELRFTERQGPALVDLSLFGYFATAVLNPRGLSSIRHSAS